MPKPLRIPRLTEPCSLCDGTGHRIDPAALGPMLRSRREDAGVGLREVSRAIGISATHVSDVENGRRGASGQWVERYLAALQTVSQPSTTRRAR